MQASVGLPTDHVRFISYRDLTATSLSSLPIVAVRITELCMPKLKEARVRNLCCRIVGHVAAVGTVTAVTSAPRMVGTVIGARSRIYKRRPCDWSSTWRCYVSSWWGALE